MAKTLKVVTPFFAAEAGDKFQLNDKGMYVLSKNEEFYKIANDASSDVKATFASDTTISQDYAAELLDDGLLEEVTETKDQNKTFVNVFDEINGLIDKYSTELENIKTTMKDSPEVLRLEKTTVLSNLIKVLTYLKNLKK